MIFQQYPLILNSVTVLTLFTWECTGVFNFFPFKKATPSVPTHQHQLLSESG